MEIPSAVSANPESELSLYALPEVVTDEIVDGSGRLITDETKKEMKKVLTEIQDGTFARNWILENRVNRPHFNAERRIHSEHQLEKVGKELRKMYSWNDEQ